jgi:hypothetical protein
MNDVGLIDEEYVALSRAGKEKVFDEIRVHSMGNIPGNSIPLGLRTRPAVEKWFTGVSTDTRSRSSRIRLWFSSYGVASGRQN